MLTASVAMPTFNRREILLQTLASLERQSVEPSRYEVLVCVDGSTDGTI
ncbi:MAG: glycosyltransferase, partial [Chloroflexi bacterium]